MLDHARVSIVIPCYNEEVGIKKALESVTTFANEVIVVDNNSDDHSVQIAKSYNARVIIEKSRGYGRAIKKGLEHAGGDYIMIMDGDGSYSAEELKKMRAYMLSKDLDFLTGCRFPLKDQTAMPFINLRSNYFVSWLIRFLFRINIIDSQSGMVMFKKSVLPKLALKNLGMGFSQEIKIRALLNPNLNCGEMHIGYYPRVGKVKFRKIKDGIGNLWDLLILRVRLKNEFSVA